MVRVVILVQNACAMILEMYSFVLFISYGFENNNEMYHFNDYINVMWCKLSSKKYNTFFNHPQHPQLLFND